MTRAKETINQINSNRLLQAIRNTIHQIEPSAEIILFGSHARGDANENSDWDILILVEGEISCDRMDQINHRLFELNIEHDVIICPMINSKTTWYNSIYVNPFLKGNIEREGVVL
jgi:uncharacterized protein